MTTTITRTLPAPKVKKSGYTEREPETAIVGRSFTPYIGLADFRSKQSARLTEESACASQGLQILIGMTEMDEKTPCISPILAKGTDICSSGGTLKKVISEAHPWWKQLFPTSPMTYAIQCCHKHLRVVHDGDTIVFSTETFQHKGFECLLCMKKGNAYSKFKLDCIPVDTIVDEKTWILFDRQRPR